MFSIKLMLLGILIIQTGIALYVASSGSTLQSFSLLVVFVGLLIGLVGFRLRD